MNESGQLSADALADVAADAVAAALDGVPRARLAIVTGSGLGEIAAMGSELAAVEYRSIPGLGAGTVAGHAGRWLVLETSVGPVYCLAGRRHLYEGIAPEATGLLMRIAARLGVQRVLLTNAAGGLTGRLAPGDLMLITDQMDLTQRSPLRGFNNALGLDMRVPYDADLRQTLLATAQRHSIALAEGVYVALTGPSYETPAEARLLRLLGGDAVGMSTVPETLAARQAGLRVAAISLITNSHVLRGVTTHEEVLTRGREAAGRLRRLIEGALIETSGRLATD